MNVNSHIETETSPSKLPFKNNATKSNFDRLLHVEIMTTSGSLDQYNVTNMISNQEPSISHVSEHENISMKQLRRRRQRQRRKQRRREQRDEQQRQQQKAKQRLSELQLQQRQQQQSEQQLNDFEGSVVLE